MSVRRAVTAMLMTGLATVACGGSDADSPAAGAGIGDGVGLVTIDGVDYEFEIDACLDAFGSLDVSGFGTTDDGITFFAAVSYVLNVRDDELVPASMSDDEIARAIEAGDIQEDLGVLVDLGRADILESSPDGLSSFRADRSFDNDVEGGFETWDKQGDAVSGTGSVIDRNGVAASPSTLLPMTFAANC